MKLRWFLSPTLRQATEVSKHVHKVLHAQRDIMKPLALETVTTAVKLLDDAIVDDAPDLELLNHMKQLDDVVGKMVKPYPNANWRENVEVMLVAIVVAMAIRTFFVQPFKIPTGSMQPTLNGNVARDLREVPNLQYPGLFSRLFDIAAKGRFYTQFVPKENGEIVDIKPPGHIFRFINYQTVVIQYAGHSEQTEERFYFTPDDGFPQGRNPTEIDCGMQIGRKFLAGEKVVFMLEDAGDHLFVDRMTYNFRHPKRGEIVVFKTRGIAMIQDQTQFYIKRLVGLPNERLNIGDDRHLRINGKRLDSSTPHFENVYGFNPLDPAQANHYSGHTFYAAFSSSQFEYTISPHGYMAFGDNTMSSSDSRYWGEIPEENFIGKAFLVYWPITDRFGWGQK